MERLNLHTSGEKIRQILLENPELPVVVLAGESANIGDFSWMYCSDIGVNIEEMLDCDYFDYEDAIFTDRDRFEEKLSEDIYDDLCEQQEENPTEEQINEILQKRIREFEPYWIKVIAIKADN